MSLPAPILDLSSAASWEVVHEIGLIAQQVPGTTRHYPISPYIVPVALDRNILAIGASTPVAQPTWRLAFWLGALAQLPGIGKAETESRFVPLGLSLHQFTRYSSDYTLRVKVPKWHSKMEFKIWKYLGAESDIASLLTEIHAEIV